MIGRKYRMSKILIHQMGHSDLFHHATRSGVHGNCEREDLIQPQRLKAKLERRGRRFRRKPLSPEIGCDPPTDFNTGGERCLPGGSTETNEPDEFRGAGNFHRPATELILIKMLYESLDGVIALGPRHQSRKELHHLGIAIHRRERVRVGRTPATQQQPVRSDFLRLHSCHLLLANAELTEDPVENIVGVDYPEDHAQVIQCLAQVHRNQFVSHGILAGRIACVLQRD